MTNEEFSREFDILFNNINSSQGYGLDEYEKSVFLTKAQEEIVIDYFSNRTNKSQQGLDDSIKRQYDFSSLIITKKISETKNITEKLRNNSKFFSLPPDYFLLINETVSDSLKSYSVIPISYTEYQNKLSKPYPYPPKRIVWRLIISNNNNNTIVEIIGNLKSECTYNIRYVKKPSPIILVNLSDIDPSLSINNVKEESPCELPEIIHRDILQRAVELAKSALMGDLNSELALGVNSQTNIGMLSSK